MPPFRTKSTISPLTEELNSDLFWFGGVVDFAFYEDTFSLVEGTATTLDGPPSPPTYHLRPSFEDYHFGLPPAQSGVGERADSVDLATNIFNAPLNARPEDLYELFSLSIDLDH